MTPDEASPETTETAAPESNGESTSVVFRHEPALSRYTLELAGATVGFADYEIAGQDVLFTHVEVDPTHRGEGLAGILVEQALDDVRTGTTLTVVPVCPYVVRWIDLHAEYQDLLTRGR
ncbi:N-acetyltransferase [Cryobacterium sinapicolor]|uniref:N-acetyltransferase n=1 Tax=Cryobacterium sinapicolor TaxID=1259236 RepID=A0ABY2J5G1_9MICO|nr:MULTISPECIES: GNAT family N-acetyltransferase [Cryobacterium]TFC90746.1 N-acetyltransferase [Cryobacterium sp. TMT3-29-2]TFC98938.1 N-acetyltransferase [Cryobacterium sinapicolor]